MTEIIYNRKLVKGTSPNEDKIIAIFQKNEKEGVTRVLYGDKPDKVYIANEDKFKQYRSKPQTSPYILIKFDKKSYKTLKEQYEKTYKEAVYLKELTKGKINLFRTGSTAKSALQLFYDLCPVKETDPDPICTKEEKILQEATNGAMIWVIKYKGKGYKYDVVSEYPSIMISRSLKIPFGGVVFSKMTNDELKDLKFFKYGIYHVKILDLDYRLIRQNGNDWYTHTDLNYAMNELKYKLEIVEDGEDNAMQYTKLRSIRDVFKPFVDYLFELKQKGIKEVKKYINALWGALSQKNTLDVCFDKIHGNNEIFSSMPNYNDLREDDDPTHHEATIYKKSSYYELPYARIGHFIIASGRLKISNIIRVNLDNVVRVHTDGLILTKPIQNVVLGENIGDLKFEEEGQCTVNNSCDYVFNGVKHGKKEKEICMFI